MQSNRLESCAVIFIAFSKDALLAIINTAPPSPRLPGDYLYACVMVITMETQTDKMATPKEVAMKVVPNSSRNHTGGISINLGPVAFSGFPARSLTRPVHGESEYRPAERAS